MREKLFETRVSGRVGLKWQGYIGVNQAALRLLKRKLDEKNEVFGEEKRSKILCSFCFTVHSTIFVEKPDKRSYYINFLIFV